MAVDGRVAQKLAVLGLLTGVGGVADVDRGHDIGGVLAVVLGLSQKASRVVADDLLLLLDGALDVGGTGGLHLRGISGLQELIRPVLLVIYICGLLQFINVPIYGLPLEISLHIALRPSVGGLINPCPLNFRV